MLAAQYDRVKVVKLLLLKGADLSKIDMVSHSTKSILVDEKNTFQKILITRNTTSYQTGRSAYSLATKGISRTLIHAAVDEKKLPENDSSSTRSVGSNSQCSPYISVISQVNTFCADWLLLQLPLSA